jgi:hypothetical protein
VTEDAAGSWKCHGCLPPNRTRTTRMESQIRGRRLPLFSPIQSDYTTMQGRLQKSFYMLTGTTSIPSLFSSSRQLAGSASSAINVWTTVGAAIWIIDSWPKQV